MVAMGVFVSVTVLLVVAGYFLFAAYHLSFHSDYFNWVQDTQVSSVLSYALLVFDATFFAMAASIGLFGTALCIWRKQTLFFHWVQKGDRVYEPKDMSTRVTFEESRFISWWNPVFKNGGVLARHQKL